MFETSRSRRSLASLCLDVMWTGLVHQTRQHASGPGVEPLQRNLHTPAQFLHQKFLSDTPLCAMENTAHRSSSMPRLPSYNEVPHESSNQDRQPPTTWRDLESVVLRSGISHVSARTISFRHVSYCFDRLGVLLGWPLSGGMQQRNHEANQLPRLLVILGPTA